MDPWCLPFPRGRAAQEILWSRFGCDVPWSLGRARIVLILGTRQQCGESYQRPPNFILQVGTFRAPALGPAYSSPCFPLKEKKAQSTSMQATSPMSKLKEGGKKTWKARKELEKFIRRYISHCPTVGTINLSRQALG